MERENKYKKLDINIYFEIKNRQSKVIEDKYKKKI